MVYSVIQTRSEALTGKQELKNHKKKKTMAKIALYFCASKNVSDKVTSLKGKRVCVKTERKA